MRRIKLSALRNDFAQTIELLFIRARTGRVHQARGETCTSGVKGILQQTRHTIQFDWRERTLPQSRHRDAQASVTRQWSDPNVLRSAFHGIQIGSCARPSPSIALSQDAAAKFAKFVYVVALRKRREAAVPDNFRGHALQHLFRAIFLQHLQIGVAVKINEAGRHSERTAIEPLPFRLELDGANLSDAIAINQQVAANGFNARSVKEKTVLEEQHYLMITADSSRAQI